MSAKTKQRAKQQAKGFTKFLSVLRTEAVLNAYEVNKQIARRIVELSKQKIEQQEYHWIPLSEHYLDQKIREGHDPRIYIRTREFLGSIGWGVTHGRIWAGIPAQKIHEDSGLPLWLLARFLEFGTSRIPPRPIWRPVLSTVMGERPDFAVRYRKALKQSMRGKARRG